MLQEEGDVSGIDAMWAMQCNTVHEWPACYNIKNAEQGGLRHEMKNYHGVLLPDVLLG